MTKAQEQRRQRAIDRSLAGDPLEDICRALACSKSGLDTWRDRYLAPDPSGSAELSRRPRATPTKTPQRLAQVVVALRQTLAQHGPSCGAASMQQALAQQGIEPVPSQRTIYRILHRYDKETTETKHHEKSVQPLGHFLPVLPWLHSPGNMAT
jgi:putative transposase